MDWTRTLTIATAISLLTGCATVLPPQGKQENAERAIALAVQAGASRYAPTELDIARKKYTLALNWIGRQADANAIVWLLEQAEVDAQLAAVMASAKQQDALARR